MAIDIIDGFNVNKNVPIDTNRTIKATIAERDAIPMGVRYEGMETRVIATKTKYVLEGGTANANWKPMVSSSIPDYAYRTVEEIRGLDVSAIAGAVDVWLYPNKVYEWDAFSVVGDNGDTVLKPIGIADGAAGRFVLRTELAVKNHTHLPEPSHYDNGIVSEEGKVRLGGRVSQKRSFVFDTIFDLSQTKFNNTVLAFVKLNDGKYLVGGYFTMCNGISANRIARLNADGSFDATFDYFVDGYVRRFLKLPDGSVLAYGDFYTIQKYSDTDGSQTVLTGQLLKFTQSGEYDASFIPTIFNGAIIVADIQSDGKIIVGGNFTGVYNNEGVISLNVGRIARIMPNGGIDETFITGTQFGGIGVYSICINNDDGMLVGGRFNTYNGVATPSIIMLDKDGNKNPSFAPLALGTGVVNDIKKTNSGDYLVTGSFTSYGGNTLATKIIRLFANGGLDTAFNKEDFEGISTDLTVTGLIDVDGSGSQFYAFGSFSTINGTVSNRIAIIDATTGMVNQNGFVSPFDGESSNIPFAYDTGGFLFLSMSSGTPSYIGAINYNGGFYSEMANFLFDGFLEYVRDMSAQYTDMALIHKAYLHNQIKNFINDAPNDGQSYIRQNLTWAVLKLLNGLSYNNGMVTLGGDITQRTTLTNTKTRLNFEAGFALQTGMVNMLGIKCLPNGDYLVHGRALNYNSIYYTSSDKLIKINRFGDFDHSFAVNFGFTNTEISFVLPLSDGKLLMHGGQNLNGVNTNYLFKLNVDGTRDNTFNALSAYQPSYIFCDTAVELSTGELVVSYINNSSSYRIIKLNGSTGAVVNGYDANTRAFDGAIRGLVKLPNDEVLVYGAFTTYNNQSRSRIAKFLSNGQIDVQFNIGAGFNGTVGMATIQPDGKILLIGSFTSYNGTPVKNFVRLLPNGALDATFNPTFQNMNGGTVAFVKTLADGKIIVGGSFTCEDNIRYLRVFKPDGTYDTSFCGGKTPTTNMVTGICILDDKMTIIGEFSSYLVNSTWVTVNCIANIDFNGQLIRDYNKFSISGFPVEYGEDQSQNYTDRSLVDKGFVAAQLTDRVRRKEFNSISIIKDSPFTLTHNLRIRAVRATVYDEATWAVVPCDAICTDNNNVTITVAKSNYASATIIIEG